MWHGWVWCIKSLKCSNTRGRPNFGFGFSFGAECGQMGTFGRHSVSAESSLPHSETVTDGCWTGTQHSRYTTEGACTICTTVMRSSSQVVNHTHCYSQSTKCQMRFEQVQAYTTIKCHHVNNSTKQNLKDYFQWLITSSAVKRILLCMFSKNQANCDTSTDVHIDWLTLTGILQQYMSLPYTEWRYSSFGVLVWCK